MQRETFHAPGGLVLSAPVAVYGAAQAARISTPIDNRLSTSRDGELYTYPDGSSAAIHCGTWPGWDSLPEHVRDAIKCIWDAERLYPFRLKIDPLGAKEKRDRIISDNSKIIAYWLMHSGYEL